MSPSLFDLAKAQSLNLADEAQTAASGIVSRTLLQAPNLRIVLFAFAEGQELTQHTNSHRAVVQVLVGRCEFHFNNAWKILEAGSLLHLPPYHPHAVRSVGTAFTMLLTLGSEEAKPAQLPLS